jgi:(R,R)-butanediol dehydrogenase/meso-butanediol dehydrogenase/diacetyl reductase
VVSQGLGPVIALDVDNDRLEKARKLGAGYLVNSREQDPVEAVRAMTAGAGVDIVIEASGAPPAPALAMELVKRGGRILIVGMQAEPRALDLHELAVREIEITSTNAHVCDVDLPEAIKVLATSNLAPLMLDRVLSLDELVSEGIMAMAEGRARGKILVDPSLS